MFPLQPDPELHEERVLALLDLAVVELVGELQDGVGREPVVHAERDPLLVVAAGGVERCGDPIVAADELHVAEELVGEEK